MNNWITPGGYETGVVDGAPKDVAYVQAYGELGGRNAGLLLDKEGTMAVDALMVPAMTKRFVAQIKKVTRKPVTRLVNTHHHIDHVGGNFFFREAEIVSHTFCREEMSRTGLPVELLQKRLPRFAAEFSKLKLAVPEVTFEDRLIFHQAGRDVELRHL